MAKAGLKVRNARSDVGLGPRPALPHPVGRVLEREEDVVDVDPHARAEPGEHLEQQVVHVRARPGHVRRVHEQHVAGAERLEHVGRDVLDRLAVDRDAVLVVRSQQALQQRGERLHEGDLGARQPAVDRVEQQCRRVARPDLDDPRRPQPAQHGVQDHPVAVAVGVVVVPVAPPAVALALVLGERGLGHQGGQLGEEGELLVLPQVDARELAARVQQPGGPALVVGQVGVRRVEVAGRHPGLVRVPQVLVLRLELAGTSGTARASGAGGRPGSGPRPPACGRRGAAVPRCRRRRRRRRRGHARVTAAAASRTRSTKASQPKVAARARAAAASVARHAGSAMSSSVWATRPSTPAKR